MPTNNIREFLQGKSLLTSTNEEKERNLYRVLLKSRSGEPCYESNPQELLNAVSKLGPRQVCQYQFKTNDIVWICRECQKDETCVLCNVCYLNSCHEGHDVYFYHSAVGGCCDCGDPDAWNPEGFCQHHGKKTKNAVMFIPEDIRGIAVETFKDISSEIVKYCQEFSEWFTGDAPLERDESEMPTDSYDLHLYYDEFHNAEDYVDTFSADLATTFQMFVSFNNALIADGKWLIHSVPPEEFPALCTMYHHFRNKGFRMMVTNATQRKRAEHVLLAVQWLHAVSQTNDGFCQLICDAFSIRDMVTILTTSMKLDKALVKALHSLFITLMALQSFKMVSAAAYASAFGAMSTQFGLGFGISGTTMYNISVQFLNRDWVVNELIFNHNFLPRVMVALKEMMLDSTRGVAGYEYQHNIMSKRRYNPIIGDLKVIFGSVEGSAQIFLSTCFDQLLELLATFQCIHRQTRATLMHVSFETREWMDAFNLILGITLLFDYTYGWLERDPQTTPPVNGKRLTDGTEVLEYDSTTSVGFQLVEPHVVTELNEFLAEEARAGKLSGFGAVAASGVGIVTAVGTDEKQDAVSSASSIPAPKRSFAGGLFKAFFGNSSSNGGTVQSSVSPSKPAASAAPPPAAAAAASTASEPPSTVRSIPMMSISSILAKFLEKTLDWQNRYLYSTPVEALPFISNLTGDGKRHPLWSVYQWSRDERSFHLPLHRGFAKAVLECCRYEHHNDTVYRIREDLRRKLTDVFAFIEFPLSVLIFAAQIKQGMWRRNGYCMQDQLLNYGEIPFCRIYKDLDYFLIQLALTVYSGHYFLSQMFHRFDLTKSLLSHQLIMGSDSQYFCQMLDEALKMVINLVTELPQPGGVSGSDNRMRAYLRRDLIHRLVCTNSPSGVTFSQLKESVSHAGENVKISGEVVDSVIFELSDKHVLNPMQPPSYTLKKELWSEYDPCYPRISEALHQSAIEKRPRLSGHSPMVARPTECHPCFASVRPNLLFDHSLWIVVRDVMLITMAHRGKEGEEYEDICSNWELKMSESVYSTSIQMLTLILHEALSEIQSTSFKPSSAACNAFIVFLGEPVSRDLPLTWLKVLLDLYTSTGSSSTGEVNTKFWLGWILDSISQLNTVYSGAIKEAIEGNEAAKNRKEQENEARKNQTRDKALADMQANAEKFKAMLAEMSDDEDDDDEEEDYEKLYGTGAAASATTAAATTGAGGAKASSTGTGSDEGKETANDEDESGAVSPTDGHMMELLRERKMSIASSNSQKVSGAQSEVASAEKEEEELLCITCQRGHTAEDPFNVLAYLALSQCSKVCASRSPSIRLVPPQQAAELSHFASNMKLSFCGHAMHLKCYHTYFESSKRKSAEQRHLIYDPEKNQFLCPLCKKLNNLVVPDAVHFYSNGKELPRKDSSPPSEVDVDAWLRWINAPELLTAEAQGVAESPSLKEKSNEEEEKNSGWDDEIDGTEEESVSKRMRTNSNAAAVGARDGVAAAVAASVDAAFLEYSETAAAVADENVVIQSSLTSIDDFLMKQLHSNFWLKFLKELTIVYSAAFPVGDTLEFERNLIASLQTGVSGVTFSIVTDSRGSLSCESGRGSNKESRGSGGGGVVSSKSRFDDLKFLPRVVEALAAMMATSEYLQPLHSALMLPLRGRSGGKSSDESNQSAGGWLWVSDVKKVHCASLLSLQLLDYFVLCVCVAKGQKFLQRKHFQLPLFDVANSEEYVQCCLRWVCLARLVQLIRESKTQETNSNDELKVAEDSAASLLYDSVHNVVCGGGESSFKNKCLEMWRHFLIQMVRITGRICSDLMPSDFINAGPEYSIDALLDTVGLSLSSEEATEGITAVVRLWLSDDGQSEEGQPCSSAQETLKGPAAFDENEMIPSSPKSSAGASSAEEAVAPTLSRVVVPANKWYGNPTTPMSKLLELPEDYSKLHSHVVSLCSYDAPCLCLVCGAVLDGGGKGQCSAHTTVCGGESCVFFQLQDCSVLLCYGGRMAVYPAPYVDKYGETQHSYRGKPLRLDRQRYDTLNQIWNDNQIAREVTARRAGSTSVIVLGYY